ncbi:hypothetical protein EVAR_94513_1 [Eumeta japonica]|uniref:Mariner Mos1 transposase n=1 Tax=Eumeta variegata TaxID=151549 RepID=A0A4C1UUU5_EUMVA|nr:hypothetical protein EVAR_94513_1 [Eumeta japonica]
MDNTTTASLARERREAETERERGPRKLKFSFVLKESLEQHRERDGGTDLTYTHGLSSRGPRHERVQKISCHTSAETTLFLEGQKIKLTSHPPYSPDLAPNDFYLFPKQDGANETRPGYYCRERQICEYKSEDEPPKHCFLL